MSLVLLDTTFLIDAERSGRGTDDAIDDDDDVAIAAITIAELLVGVELASKRQRPSRERFVEAVVNTIPVIPYDVDVAVVHAELLAAVQRSGQPRGAHDLIIAATALARRRTVLSADASGFEGLPGVDFREYR